MSRPRVQLRGSLVRNACLGFVLALLGACGGGNGESEEVRDAVRSYLAAVADRDGRRACRWLSRDAQLRTFRSRRAHAGADHPAQACAAVVEAFGPLYGVRRIRAVRVERIRVEGDRARAVADGFPVRLEKIADQWKITRAGLAQGIGDTPPRERG